jgi:DNA-binding response OmpR family regulator
MISNPAAAGGSLARILVVDDNPDVAHVMGVLLEMCGYAVEVVIDAKECLSRLESFHPDIVLLDPEISQVHGHDLAKQIRTQLESERVSIIAISGYADAAHQARSIESGCDQYLVKPADLVVLEGAIARELQKSHSAACDS